MRKKEFRQELLQKRRNLENKWFLSEQLNLKAIKYLKDNFNKNIKIASYSSFRDEVDTSTLNKHFQVYLPIIHPFIKRGLWFVKDTIKYRQNKFNIPEPVYSIKDILAPWELDIILVPLVGFNEKKYRMGMGGGFYDYSFKFKKSFNSPLAIGLAFDEQQNNDIIIDSHDIALDVIITPTRIL